MRSGRILLACALLTATFSANAMTLDSYKRIVASNPQLAENYIAGVFQGIHWSNAFNIIDGGKPSHCPPAKLVLNTSNIKKIIDDELALSPGVYEGDDHIESVLFKGLQRTFPCG